MGQPQNENEWLRQVADQVDRLELADMPLHGQLMPADEIIAGDRITWLGGTWTVDGVERYELHGEPRVDIVPGPDRQPFMSVGARTPMWVERPLGDGEPFVANTVDDIMIQHGGPRYVFGQG